MGSEFFTAIVAIATAIVGVAIISVIVSPQAQTATVVTSAGQAFGYDLGVAVSPLSGNLPSALQGLTGINALNNY